MLLTPQHFTAPGLSIGRGRALGIWSKEAVTGSYDTVTDTWTPGRGSDGRVTEASWALVPLERWVRVAGTVAQSVLNAAIQAAIPGWTDWGDSGLDGVFKAWSGMAVDPTPTKAEALFWGGGHTDSSNNGVYKCDFARMSWSVAIMPSNPANWVANYDTGAGNPYGSFSVYPPAQAYQDANPTDYSIRADCFYPHAPNEPTSRHTYSSLAINPKRNEMYCGVRRMWTAHLDTQTWTPGNPNPQITGDRFSGENVFGYWDEVKDEYVVVASQSGGIAWRHNPVTGIYSDRPGGTPMGGAFWACGFCKYERDIFGFLRPDSSGYNPPTFFRQNLDTMVTQQIVVTGDVAGDLFALYEDGTAAAWIPQKQKLLVFTKYRPAIGSPYTYQSFWVDPAAATCTSVTLPGNFASSHMWVESKFQYVPQLGAVVYVDAASSDIRIMRFA